MTDAFINRVLIPLLVVVIAFFSVAASASKVNTHSVQKPVNPTIRLATTTSTDNSGLLDYLLPAFEQETGYHTQVIAVGTGKALRMGRDGDVDVLLVHAPNAERQFVDAGFGEKRFAVMVNDFVIVGPRSDSQINTSSHSVTDVLKSIAAQQKLFLSRGDNSGTHKKELSLWQSAHTTPDAYLNPWYRETGQGMGRVLQMAGEMDAYTLTDRGTWLALKSRLPLKIIFQGDARLNNPYGIIAVNKDKYPKVNSAGAHALIQWITSDKGQRLIGAFKVSGKTLFKPCTTNDCNVKITTQSTAKLKP